MYLVNGLMRSARVRPDHPAIVQDGGTITYAALCDRVARMAGALAQLERTGDRDEHGDRIAILALNGPAYLEAIYAVPWAGAVLVPLNTRLAEDELAYMIKDADVGTLLFDTHHAQTVAALARRCPTLRNLIQIDCEPWQGEAGQEKTGKGKGVPDALNGPDLIAATAPIPDRCGSGDDLYALCYTGGTTGRPKGVMLTHAGMQHHVSCLLVDMRWREDTRYLHVTPMFHLADLGPSYSLTMLGGTHVFLPEFTIPGLLDALERHAINAVNLVPTLIGWLVDDPDVANRDLHRLRDIGYGSAPMSEGVLRRALTMFPDVTFRQFYGMTEIAASLSVLRPEHHTLSGPMVSRLQSAGQPTYSVVVRIVDGDGQEVGQGEVGEIECRTPGLMAGYWRDAEQTRAAITEDGFMRTGDMGYFDKGGFLFVVDRAKDMVVTGGENVFSSEVESAISSCSGVAQVAVIGIPDARWGEAVHAIVVPANGQTPDERTIIDHCRTLIAGYKCPKSVSFRTGPLPLSGGGKVQKNVLRAPFWEGADRAVN